MNKKVFIVGDGLDRLIYAHKLREYTENMVVEFDYNTRSRRKQYKIAFRSMVHYILDLYGDEPKLKVYG